MRLEILVEMQIEILNGGEILVSCKFIWARGGEAQRAEAAARHQGRSKWWGWKIGGLSGR